MIIAFPAIVRKQSQLMTPPRRSHPPTAKRLWTRKGEASNITIYAIFHVYSLLYILLLVIYCYEPCCVFSFRRQKSTESAGSDEEDLDELTLVDHKEIMSRITLKQEVSWCSYIFLRMCCDHTSPVYRLSFILLDPHRLKSVTQT